MECAVIGKGFIDCNDDVTGFWKPFKNGRSTILGWLHLRETNFVELESPHAEQKELSTYESVVDPHMVLKHYIMSYYSSDAQ